ncbi:MAG: molybdopterin cofactor-binding domain-containing protein, partial [Sphingomonadales bacterium]
MSSGPLITRRQAVQGAGALTIAFALPLGAGTAPAQGRLPGSLGGNPQLDAWLRIGADGKVTVFTGKIELGQGIATALSQIAADELDVDIGRLRMVTADTELTPNEGYTFGSLSIQQSGTAIRFAAAEARAILLELAAARLAVKRDRLSVGDGVVSSGQESVTYWELIGNKTLHRQASGKISPKRPGERRYAGKPMPRRDIPPKVFGEESFLQDIKLPGMLHGRVVHPPDPGAKLLSLDEKAVQDMPGVVAVVRDGRFLGVIAKREYQAVEAARALTKAAKWKPGPALPASDRIADYVLSQKAETSIIKDAPAPEIAAAASHAARYTRAFQAHASIGPSAAIARFEGDRLTL